jgi:hypothetical protein
LWFSDSWDYPGELVDIKQYVSNAVAIGVDSITNKVTQDLRRKAQSTGWPLHLVLNLKVVVEPASGNLVITYPDQYSKEIELLEDGTQDTPGTHFLKNFNNRVDSLVRQYSVTYERDLLELVDII